MKIRNIIIFTLLCLPCSSWGQEQFKIMDWKSETTLRTYLIQEVHKQYDQRRNEVAYALRSEQGITDYRFRCRERYLSLLGGFPEETPLDACVTKRVSSGAYSVENIIFESRPGHHVTSNLYLPTITGRLPAVLLLCGHEMTSKATDSYQKTAILFAQHGFVVLVVDPISQGERVQFTDSLGKRILRGSTTEHTLLNAGANLVGTGVVAWELYDNVRALDYLCSRPEVDKQKIGCLGNSGGGTQTAYFIAFDDRIKVAAPCSFIARRERNLELAGASDGCQHIPYEGSEHLEIGDFLIMFAPKPLLILAGRYDFVDYRGAVETCNELAKVYRLFDEEEKLLLFTEDDGHGISAPKREKAVEWFSRWLKDEKTKIKEGPVRVLDEHELFCTANGQVNSSFTNEKDVQDFTLEEAHDLDESRKEFLETSDFRMKQQKIRDLLAISDGDSALAVETKGEDKVSDYVIKKIILRRDGEVPLPCLYYTPSDLSGNDTVVICIYESGKNTVASDNRIISSFMRSGNPVIVADLRGMGETSEPAEANDWKYYNSEYNNAMISLHIGRPLPGQRVEDIFIILKYISGDKYLRKLPVKVIATGSAAPVALYAAILRPEIIEVEISSTIKSYFEILENPMEKNWYSYVVPGVLKYFDLPDVLEIRPELIIRYKK